MSETKQLQNDVSKYWEGLKEKFPKDLAEQLAKEIPEITHPRDARMIVATIKGYVEDELQEGMVWYFNKLVEMSIAAIFKV